MRSILPLGSLLACGVGLVAAFLPWGSFRLQAFDGQSVTVTLNAWNGNLSLLGLTIPNWMVAISLLAIGTAVVLREIAIWEAPRALCIALSSYGFVHMTLYLVVLGAQGTQASIGAGTFLMLLAAAALLAMSIAAVFADRKTHRPPSVRDAITNPGWGPVAMRSRTLPPPLRGRQPDDEPVLR